MTRAGESGFTLLELLVSLTLLGLVFVLLFGGLRFGTRAWERTASLTDASDSVRLTQSVLRNAIERACPRLLTTTDQHSMPPRVDFAGSPQALAMLGPAPGSAGGQSCARLTFAVRPDGTLKRLVLVMGDDSVNATVLLRRAQSVDLAYRAASGGWQSSWSAAALPSLVRIRAIFPKDDTRLWPELFVSPRISAEADCTYDPVTGTCRSG
jgi:general secretion pathway protein J